MSVCWAAVTDPQLLQNSPIDSFPRFFHGAYCRPQSIHWTPDDPFHVDCEDADNLIKVTAPWDWLCLEVLGPMPVTRNGHRYILTVTDLHSKWVEALPLRACVSAQVTRRVVDLVRHFGYPAGVLTRLPRDLVQQINTELREPLSMRSSLLVFHRGAGSLDATTQRAVGRMVGELVRDHAADWDVFLPAQVFGLCLQEHPTTGRRPFSVLLAKEVERVRTPRPLNCTTTIQKSVFVVN